MGIASSDVPEFEAAARERVTELAGDPADGGAVKALFRELAESALPRSEVARRTARLAEMLLSAADFQQALTDAAPGSDAAVRAAIVSLLPPSLQQAAYRPPADGGPPKGDDDTDDSAQPESEQIAAQAEEPDADEGESTEWRTVLLLGSAKDTAENGRLLRDREFIPVRVSTPEQLEGLAGEQICGLIVHKSWWQQLPGPEARVSFVRNQVRRSNFLQLKIDCRGLGEAEALVSAAIEEFDLEVREHISVTNGSLPTDLDYRKFSAVADLLSRAAAARVGIDGFDEMDRQLLASAVESFASHKHLARTSDGESLTVQPISVGQSGARVYTVRSAAFQTMLVAKLAPLDALQDELERARRAMPPSLQIDTELCIYSFGGRGVLLQRLYTALDQPADGAPSLRERLEQCAAWERGRPGMPEPSLGDLEQGVDRMVERVKEVNREATHEPETTGWMTVEPLDQFASRDIRWSIESSDDTFDPAALVPRVREILAAEDRTRIVHGDLHTSNLLLRDDRTPSLIDFAMAGAGHPCFDLVRIGSGLAYQFIRPLLPEAELRRFFARVHIDGASKDELLGEFSQLINAIGPKLAIHTLTLCRQASIEALGEIEPDAAVGQYLAMTYLVGAQSLAIPGFQVAVVRAALGAVAPAIAAA